MLRTTLAGLRLHKGRLVTTALAVALGVMFVSGALVFSDTLRQSYEAQIMGSAQQMDAIALPEDATAARGEEVPEDPVISRDALADVRGLPEIEQAAGVTQAPAPLLDKDGRAVGSMPTLGVSAGDLSRYSAAEGELPQGPGEVAIATTTADRTGYEVGDTATVLDSGGEERTFTVSGLVDFGIDDEINYRGAVVFTPATAQDVTGADGLAEIDAIAADGVPAEQAVTAVEGVVGDDTEVLTGQALGERLTEDAGGQADVIATGLLLFALVSLVVAAIVIHNTFAILVAQRQREMALLRCIGAVRGQVFRSVILEALVVGLVASAAGVLAGIGLGTAGFALGSEALASGAPDTAVVVTPLSVLIGLLTGTAMTLFAALFPARRATAVPPLAALRSSSVATGLDKRLGAVRAVIGALLLLVSAGGIALAVNMEDSQTAMYVVFGAGAVAFAGVVVLGPLLVRAAVALVSPLMRLLGVSGTMAADNARRNPRRAATAMIALTVGATLISGYAVFNATLMKTTDAMLDKQFPSDYMIRSQVTDADDSGVPGAVARDLRESPQVKQVVTLREAELESADSGGGAVYTYRGEHPSKLDVVPDDAVTGDLADVQQGGIAVLRSLAGNREVGDTMTVRTEQGERSFEIAALVDTAAWSVLMAPGDFASSFPDVNRDTTVMIDGAESADAEQLRDTVLGAVADYPTLQVESLTQMRQEYEDVMASAFLAVVAMLGLAVVIAVFGIANTLALSVLERTRESALLRALGLKRGQLRLMLLLEAVLLCLIGAVVGIALGAVFGWAMVQPVFDDPRFSVPADQISLFIAAAIGAGLLASVLPSGRAARTSITAALASE